MPSGAGNCTRACSALSLSMWSATLSARKTLSEICVCMSMTFSASSRRASTRLVATEPSPKPRRSMCPTLAATGLDTIPMKPLSCSSNLADTPASASARPASAKPMPNDRPLRDIHACEIVTTGTVACCRLRSVRSAGAPQRTPSNIALVSMFESTRLCSAGPHGWCTMAGAWSAALGRAGPAGRGGVFSSSSFTSGSPSWSATQMSTAPASCGVSGMVGVVGRGVLPSEGLGGVRPALASSTMTMSSASASSARQTSRFPARVACFEAWALASCRFRLKSDCVRVRPRHSCFSGAAAALCP
mmetsp:Transcript_38744/g.121449  ORF Transcript_38744/g.121449 Transcript_38744/m.121449 type:complete len:302 (+) Transcript_38744:2201-3106(+)